MMPGKLHQGSLSQELSSKAAIFLTLVSFPHCECPYSTIGSQSEPSENWSVNINL